MGHSIIKEQDTYRIVQSTHWRVKWAIWGQYVKLEWEGVDSVVSNLLVGAKGQNTEVFWAIWTRESYKLKFPSRTKTLREIWEKSAGSWTKKIGTMEREVTNKERKRYRIVRFQEIQNYSLLTILWIYQKQEHECHEARRTILAYSFHLGMTNRNEK